MPKIDSESIYTTPNYNTPQKMRTDTYSRVFEALKKTDLFVDGVSNLIVETRKRPLDKRISYKPFVKQTFFDMAIQTMPIQLSVSPTFYLYDSDIELLRPPMVFHSKPHFVLHKKNVLDNISADHLSDVVDVNLMMTNNTVITGTSREASHSIVVGYNKLPFQVKYMVVTFSTHTGCRYTCIFNCNLNNKYTNQTHNSGEAESRFHFSHGHRMPNFGCVNRAYQAYKALFLGFPDKAKEILSIETGFGAHCMGHSKSYTENISPDKQNLWESVELQKLVEVRLTTLLDPVMLAWMEDLYQFCITNGISEILFLCLGELIDHKYSCGMRAPVVHDLLENGHYDSLKERMTNTNKINLEGGAMTKFFSLYYDMRQSGFVDMHRVFTLDMLFDMKATLGKRQREV